MRSPIQGGGERVTANLLPPSLKFPDGGEVPSADGRVRKRTTNKEYVVLVCPAPPAGLTASSRGRLSTRLRRGTLAQRSGLSVRSALYDERGGAGVQIA